MTKIYSNITWGENVTLEEKEETKQLLESETFIDTFLFEPVTQPLMNGIKELFNQLFPQLNIRVVFDASTHGLNINISKA